MFRFALTLSLLFVLACSGKDSDASSETDTAATQAKAKPEPTKPAPPLPKPEATTTTAAAITDEPEQPARAESSFNEGERVAYKTELDKVFPEDQHVVIDGVTLRFMGQCLSDHPSLTLYAEAAMTTPIATLAAGSPAMVGFVEVPSDQPLNTRQAVIQSSVGLVGWATLPEIARFKATAEVSSEPESPFTTPCNPMGKLIWQDVTCTPTAYGGQICHHGNLVQDRERFVGTLSSQGSTGNHTIEHYDAGSDDPEFLIQGPDVGDEGLTLWAMNLLVPGNGHLYTSTEGINDFMDSRAKFSQINGQWQAVSQPMAFPIRESAILEELVFLESSSGPKKEVEVEIYEPVTILASLFQKPPVGEHDSFLPGEVVVLQFDDGSLELAQARFGNIVGPGDLRLYNMSGD